MRKFEVTMKVEGYYTATVEAKDEWEARCKAEDEGFAEADFGVLNDICEEIVDIDEN